MKNRKERWSRESLYANKNFAYQLYWNQTAAFVFVDVDFNNFFYIRGWCAGQNASGRSYQIVIRNAFLNPPGVSETFNAGTSAVTKIYDFVYAPVNNQAFILPEPILIRGLSIQCGNLVASAINFFLSYP